jgi:hypothetical protein
MYGIKHILINVENLTPEQVSQKAIDAIDLQLSKFSSLNK